jgi:hypothetical protein
MRSPPRSCPSYSHSQALMRGQVIAELPAIRMNAPPHHYLDEI